MQECPDYATWAPEAEPLEPLVSQNLQLLTSGADQPPLVSVGSKSDNTHICSGLPTVPASKGMVSRGVWSQQRRQQTQARSAFTG